MRNYNSTGSRDPIWTQVTSNPEERLSTSLHERCSTSNNNGTNESGSVIVKDYSKDRNRGLSVWTTAIFIAGEMAGSGVLALPKAIVNSGWIGLILTVVFCFNAACGGICLGRCWDILEERFPEHRNRTRNPYATIAFRAIGRNASRLVSICIQCTLFGAGTVYLLLASQIMQELLLDVFPDFSFCFWFLLIAVLLTPAMWLGSPKDFWLVGIGALFTTAFACVLMFTQIVMDGLNNVDKVHHEVHGFQDFFLSFGTLLFAFGGASTFPTIQNDMENKKEFSKSVSISFSVILALYLPVTAGGFFVYGEAVEMNIAMSLTKTILVTIANVLMAVHLIFAFLIIINPVCQELEEIFQFPRVYHWKRCLLRSLIIMGMILVGEIIPKFGKILSLVGGSTITLLTFVFPPLFYMRLCSMKNPLWPERKIPLHIKVYLWELIIIGVVGGTASTYSAILSIFGSGMAKPCFIS